MPEPGRFLKRVLPGAETGLRRPGHGPVALQPADRRA